jgi:hypothetical protein
MRRHPRSHGIDVRRGPQELFGATRRQTLGLDEPWDHLLTSWDHLLTELFGATRRQTLGLDEPWDHLLTSVEVLDEAIEQLYGGRRRADRPCGSVAPWRRREPTGRPSGDRAKEGGVSGPGR